MENNKLIAEFMGMKKDKLSSPYYYQLSEGRYYDERELKYCESWDWLMPVIQKCIRTGDNTDEWDNIFDALSLLSINAVYEEVVEFIKDYNTGEIK